MLLDINHEVICSVTTALARWILPKATVAVGLGWRAQGKLRPAVMAPMMVHPVGSRSSRIPRPRGRCPLGAGVPALRTKE